MVCMNGTKSTCHTVFSTTLSLPLPHFRKPGGKCANLDNRCAVAATRVAPPFQRVLSSNSERSDLLYEALKPVFVKREMRVYMIDLSLSREICKSVLKLDFMAHGIMESLSEFQLRVINCSCSMSSITQERQSSIGHLKYEYFTNFVWSSYESSCVI
jgi:hypothetical protein